MQVVWRLGLFLPYAMWNLAIKLDSLYLLVIHRPKGHALAFSAGPGSVALSFLPHGSEPHLGQDQGASSPPWTVNSLAFSVGAGTNALGLLRAPGTAQGPRGARPLVLEAPNAFKTASLFKKLI